jgi:hypothetical protein
MEGCRKEHARFTQTQEGAIYIQSTGLKAAFLEPNKFTKVTGFCGDGTLNPRRLVIQPDSFSDTEQVLKVEGFPETGECSL